MWTNACGETHFEFWEGLAFSGKRFSSLALFELCREFGDAQVLEACRVLWCIPIPEALADIKAECQRQENSYV